MTTSRTRRKPRTPAGKAAPVAAIAALTEWAGKSPGERDTALLIEQTCAEAWLSGLTKKAELHTNAQGSCVVLLLQKPRGEGLTERRLDPEGFAYLLGLALAGAHITVDPQGPSNNVYYGRIVQNASPLPGKHRRVSILHLLAGTPHGRRTIEPEDYHSWRRCDLGGHRCNTEREGETIPHSAVVAKRFALERFREAQAAGELAAGYDEGAYGALLDQLHAALMAVPLGKRGAIIP